MLKSVVLFYCCYLAISSPSWGQTAHNSAQNFSVEQYQNDFLLLRTKFKQVYPSLYRFNDQTTMDALFDSCYHALTNQTTPINFYTTIKYVLSAVKDGHLTCSPSKELVNQFESTEKYFPITLLFTDGKVYVKCDTQNGLASGTEIVSINTFLMPDITDRLSHYMVSDGRIKTTKYRILTENFPFYFNLVYGEQAQFTVSYKLPNGEQKTTTVYPILKKEATCGQVEVAQPGKLLQLTYPLENVGLMTIKTFSHSQLKSARENFRKFVASSFKHLIRKNVPALIIDLRSNGGGTDVYGALLYSYLTDQAFPYYAKLETVDRELTPREHPNLKLQLPKKSNYKGHVCFLVDGLSFSVTAEFCSVARSNKRGYFIGEETGGTYCGNTSGHFEQVVLPATQISVSLPTIQYTMAVTEARLKDRGILPDYPVISTVNDRLTNRDAQLTYALKLMAAQ